MSNLTSLLPQHLPILALQPDFLAALDTHMPRLILEAPTGSGKSTATPLFLLQQQLPGKIIVLQPRRIAARSLAEYLARCLNEKPGDTIGWRIRFESRVSPQTKVEFITEGILLRQLQQNPTLNGISAIILDEFHERSLYTDICLARILTLQKNTRPDLCIIVMSATLETAPLRTYLDPCTHLRCESRSFPVEIRQLKPPTRTNDPALWNDIADAFETEIIRENRPGSTLIFLPGRHEINKTLSTLNTRSWARHYDIFPLHGDLSTHAQRLAIEPSDRPRIILSTNLAETSLTVEGITSVIDSGLARVPRYDLRRGMDTLHVEKISRSAAAQRAGRAGRLMPGLCIRLWDDRDQTSRPAATTPEIHRVDLAETVLQLIASSENTHTFPWYQAPTPEALHQAERLLTELEAIETVHSTTRITPTGSRMADLPLHPRLSRMLLTAAAEGAVDDAALCAAFLTSRPLFNNKKSNNNSLTANDFSERGDISDFQAPMRAWRRIHQSNYDPQLIQASGANPAAAKEIGLTHRALLQIHTVRHAAQNTTLTDPHAVWKSLLAAYPDHVALEISPGAKIFAVAHGRRAKLSPHSRMRNATLIVATEITEISGRETLVTISGVTEIQENWLHQLFPHSSTTHNATEWDEKQKRVVHKQTRRFLDLNLNSRETGDPDPLQAAEILANQILLGKIETPHWNENVEQWILRVNLLHHLMPELGIPNFTDEDKRLVLIEFSHGATNGRQLKDRPIFPALKEWLGPNLADLPDKFAPINLTLSNGRHVKLHYEPNGEVTASAILQHLYDTTDTPTIAAGRKKIRIQLLSPARRPIAITNDLGRFWREGYEAVKTQWRGRYPKHEWR